MERVEGSVLDRASNKMRVLVLGATGMLGHVLYRTLATESEFRVLGTTRNQDAPTLPKSDRAELISCAISEDASTLRCLVDSFRPHAIVNCIGVDGAKSHAQAIWVNAYLPHRLAEIANEVDARLIQIGTDAVFSGCRGAYSEGDTPDPVDDYGRSKYLGEVSAAHCLTLRTSIVGPELGRGRHLLSWLLSQRGVVRGYRRAIFSGFPTVELAAIIVRKVLPRSDLCGILHVSSDPISKFDLLRLIVKQYSLDLKIVPDDSVVVDRSLESSLFRHTTHYRPPAWPDLVAKMREFG